MNNKLNFEGVINPNEFGGLLYNNLEVNAVKRILLNDKIFRYATGEKSECDIFEERINKMLGCKYSLGVNSGTSGLKVALTAIGIKKNDRVLVSSYTFISSATSVLNLGAVPIPMDFSFDTGIDLQDLENELKKGAKAIIVVHLQGRTFDLLEVIRLAKKYKAYVIEDSCQSFGSKFNGKYAGTFGDVGVFSFQQNKQITSGEGGMIVTNNKKIYEIARNYHDMGSVRDEYPSWEKKGALVGDNYRMTNIQAAILNVQLDKFSNMLSNQIKIYNYLTDNLDSKYVVLPNDIDGFTGQNILFYIKDLDLINKIFNKAQMMNIEVRRIWNMPYDQRKVFKDLKLNDLNLKDLENYESNNISKYLISISIPPIINNKEKIIMKKFINYISKELK